jgi:hypothetical protein
MATVTMEESEYLALKAATATANTETAAVRDELERERNRSFDERLAELSKAWNASKSVVDYAVGNLSPEFSRNWPHEDLKVLSELVDKLPGATSRDGERAIIWRDFSAQVTDFELRWKMGMASFGPSPDPNAIPIEMPPTATDKIGQTDKSIVYLILAISVALLLCGGAIVFYELWK